jgi:hypothetical protein
MNDPLTMEDMLREKGQAINPDKPDANYMNTLPRMKFDAK